MSGPFTLFYDLRWMHPGQAGGIEQASRALISTLAGMDILDRYRLLAPREAFRDWEFPRGFQAHLHYADPGEGGWPEVQAAGFDLLHSTCGYLHPDLVDFPAVLTVNDLQHVHYPGFFTPEDWRNREDLYRRSVEKARHIICISEFTRQDVHRLYGVPLEKMTTTWVIPAGTYPSGEAQRRELLAGMGLSAPFLLFPAHCWPHKNHERLVRAFALAAKNMPAEVLLVLTGRPFPEDHPAARLIGELGLGHRVVHLGYRTALEMGALFQECHALLFPSLFEGFGTPVAEAIMSGKPVACSNTTSLPEIAGDAALMFDPENVGEMAAAISEVAFNDRLRKKLWKRAMVRRALFAPARSAIRTLGVYRKALA